MGFQPDDLTAAERSAAGIEGPVGILLSEVFEDGPAHAANLRAGDIILEINGQRIYSDRQARLLVAAAKPGDEVGIIALRNGEELRTTVIVAERPGAPD